MKRQRVAQAGFTLVELTVSIVVIGVIALGLFSLFNALIKSMIIARRQSVALTLATNQLEYLKSLPYDRLAVQGGAIYATVLLPATKTEKINGVTYTTRTGIRYVDDAYDGCANYPTQADKEKYCRNYPPPSSAPATDSNAADYKAVFVSTKDSSGTLLASLDTQITARVAESASTTGALFVTIIDPSGAPVSGATVSVQNTTLAPGVALSDTTDANGVTIFYNLPPDSGNDYSITGSKTGFSSLTTMSASGALQPTYANQKILAQQSSAVSLTLAPKTPNSLILETTDTNGGALAGVRVYIKGGYKKYTSPDDSAYYYDTMAPIDTRPTTDASGLASVTGLDPINGYVFCGDIGDTGCRVGATTYYLAAALPYGGMNSLNPITVPTYPIDNPPVLAYDLGGTGHAQKVRLMLATNAAFPRLFSLSPYQLSIGTSDLSNFLVSFTGKNLSGASVTLTQGANTYAGTGCTYSVAPAPSIAYDLLKCSFDLSGISSGELSIGISNAAGTLALPVSPKGAINATP